MEELPTSMSHNDRQELLHLTSTNAPELTPLLQHTMRMNSATGLCPIEWRELFRDLGKASSVPNGLVKDPEITGPILRKLILNSSLSVQDQRSLDRRMPILAKTMHTVGLFATSESVVWNYIIPVLDRLASFAEDFLANNEFASPISVDHGTIYDDVAMGMWFPKAPIIRKLGNYDDRHNDEDNVCTKYANSGRHTLPGTFLYYCYNVLT